MGKYKNWAAGAVVVAMAGTFGYLRVSEMLRAPAEMPLSHTMITHADALKRENPEFYADAKDGYFENVYADRVEIVDERGKVIATRPTE